MDQIKRLLIIHSPKSTRAKRYDQVKKSLTSTANARGWDMVEMELTDLPYQQALQKIAEQITDDDLVVAAGGDGIAQVTFNAIYTSRRQAIFATIPLGNGNDISRAFNGRHRSVTAILDQSTADFYPLNVVADSGQTVHTFAVASYITFGATTVLVDYLNRDEGRRWRRALKGLTPAAALPVGELGQISKQINQLDFPDFSRSQAVMTDDSIGFFVIPAAHNVLRLPKNVALASSEFFFHHSITSDKGLAKKILMAGAWTMKFPGQMTELEELNFGDNNRDIVANISGDNINLGPVKRLAAIRSTRPVKVLFNR